MKAIILWYNKNMPKKPLIETNPYLRDPEKRQALIYTAVSSSTAIEVGRIITTEMLQLPETPTKTTPPQFGVSSGSQR